MSSLNSVENQSFSPPLLKALHLLTREGKLNQDAARKLKQISHLLQFIEPTVQQYLQKADETESDFSIVDMGAGKSYFGFLLYDHFFKHKKFGNVIAIESRKELIQNSLKLKNELNFDRMHFIESKIQAVSPAIVSDKGMRSVVALHACDTATDDAILFGLENKVDSFFLIPCCQAEFARLLNEAKKEFNHSERVDFELWRKPLHTREFGSHLANVVRCLWLEANGYQVNVTEFTGFEHSLKNELIIAIKKGEPLPEKKEKLQKFLKLYQLESLESRYLKII